MNAKTERTINWIKDQIKDNGGSIKLQLDVKGVSTPERKAAIIAGARESGLKVTEDHVTGDTTFEEAE